jgi:hypothetical protein
MGGKLLILKEKKEFSNFNFGIEDKDDEEPDASPALKTGRNF